MLLCKTHDIAMTALNYNGDPPWQFYLLAVTPSEQDVSGLKLFRYCTKERQSPWALLMCSLSGKCLNWLGFGFGLNPFQRSHFKIGTNRCSGTLTNEFCDDSLLRKSVQNCLIYTYQWRSLSCLHHFQFIKTFTSRLFQFFWEYHLPKPRQCPAQADTTASTVSVGDASNQIGVTNSTAIQLHSQ